MSRYAPMRRNLAALVFAALAYAGVFFAAGAQEVSTLAPASIAAIPLDLTKIDVAAAGDQKRARESLFALDASISDQFPLGRDQRVKSGVVTNQIVFGGTAQMRLARGLALYYRRVNHDNISGATNGTGFGSWGYDIESNVGLSYAFNRDLRLESFWKYRYRSCCPGAGDPNPAVFSPAAKTPTGPRVERGIMTNLAWRFGPNTRIGRSFLISEEAQLYTHHLDNTIATNPNYIKAKDTLAGLPNGPNSKLLWETHVYYYLSVYGQKKIVPYIGYENKPSYFDNATQPGFQNRVRYGVTIHMSPIFSLDTSVKNDHSYPASATAAHNTTLFTDLLIHLKS